MTTFRSEADPELGLKSKIPDGKRAISDSGGYKENQPRSQSPKQEIAER
jgi:hypothetical protein